MQSRHAGGNRTGVADFTAPPALQHAWVRQLRRFFDLYNEQYLDGELKPPIIRLSVSTRRLGEWDPLTRSISISQEHLLEHPWESVVDTLRHEMAHQYVHEVLRLPDARPHGEAFADACKRLRCDHSAHASRDALGDINESADERDKMLTRIKELFALAGSPNEHEAANAMRMANKYLLKYNIDVSETDRPRRYEVRYLGKCSGRIQEYEYTLSNILQEHFFVEIIWCYSYNPVTNKNGRVLEIAGTPENLEIAEYVYNYVRGLTDSLWKAHRREHPDAGGTRLQYLAGVLRGLDDKLDRQRTTFKEEKGLVWLGDSRLKEFHRHLHPRTRKIGGSGVTRGERYRAGVRDGKEISIHRGVRGATTRRGRLIE